VFDTEVRQDVAILCSLTGEERARALDLIAEAKRRAGQRRIDSFYPDEGPLRRELYPKHLEFFGAGKFYRERCALAANRIGKTEGMGGYETACHLTGVYPHWWKGRTFDKPVQWWAAGKTNETTRDIVQRKLFGPVLGQGTQDKRLSGTGMVYGNRLGKISWKQGVQDLVDTIQVRHSSGGWSQLGMKSYQQGRGSFEGTEQDGIWLDEEPPLDIYGECIIRTATTNGIIMLTFTPLEGVTGTVLSFLPGGDPAHHAGASQALTHGSPAARAEALELARA
jgi:phage terminase large subunit-like protein